MSRCADRRRRRRAAEPRLGIGGGFCEAGDGERADALVTETSMNAKSAFAQVNEPVPTRIDRSFVTRGAIATGGSRRRVLARRDDFWPFEVVVALGSRLGNQRFAGGTLFLAPHRGSAHRPAPNLLAASRENPRDFGPQS